MRQWPWLLEQTLPFFNYFYNSGHKEAVSPDLLHLVVTVDFGRERV